MSKKNISSNPFRQRDYTTVIQPLVLAEDLTHNCIFSSHAEFQSAKVHSGTDDHLENTTKVSKGSLRSQSPKQNSTIEELGNKTPKKTNISSSQKDNFKIQCSTTGVPGLEVDDLEIVPTISNNPFAEQPDLTPHQGDMPQCPAQENTFGLEGLPLDVDGFKRLLLTGDSSLRSTTHNPFVRSQDVGHQFENETSLSNKSSECQKFVPTNLTKNTYCESEKSENNIETEKHHINFELGIRPPIENLTPSKSRYPKLIKVELKDDESLNISQYSSSIASNHSVPRPMTPTNSHLNPCQKSTVKLNLNKPLPPAPTTNFESDNILVHSRKLAKRSISTPFYSSSSFRKIPPNPLPIRRNSHLIQGMVSGTSDFSSDKTPPRLTSSGSLKSTVLAPMQSITNYEGKRRSFSKSIIEKDSTLPSTRRQTSHWSFVHYSRPNLRATTLNRSFTS
ncbi:unnamed protein product [Blumeria hordei]|uniref:Uncharacterized protein n=1 Tax=Blumeria hordei TaxID=2867405 RepID=A0A383UIF2_BLUHO|nr:unnamed protein product [Blumeria hordei]